MPDHFHAVLESKTTIDPPFVCLRLPEFLLNLLSSIVFKAATYVSVYQYLPYIYIVELRF